MTRLSVLFSAVLLPLAAAISASFNTTTAENSSLSGSGLVEPRQRPGAPEHPILLRIMPLGASITAGVGEDSGNGYRKPLRDKLRWENWKVNYIGSKHDGDSTFHNQAHEGHPGYVVSRVHDTIKLSINRKPNLILINAGTNDANPDNKQVVVTTGQRMDAMLDDLYKMSAGVTIVLSTLIPNGRFDTNVETVNEQYREIVRRRKAAGDKIELAEMHNGFITVDDLRNDPTLTHPDKEGFRKMAAVWYGAIARVADEITAPIDTGIPDDVGDNLCDKKPGGRGPVTTQQGSGSEDGPYVHASQGRGRLHQLTVFFTDLGFPTNQLHMAQLVNAGGRPRGQEVDEIVVIHDKAFTDEYPHLNIPRHSFYLATGTGQWSSDATEFDPGLECLARGVRFGDVNNDGEYYPGNMPSKKKRCTVVLTPVQASMTSSASTPKATCTFLSTKVRDSSLSQIIMGTGFIPLTFTGGNPPRFKPTANGGLIRTGEPWCTQAGVRLGDIDGDGRLDYCCIDGQGDIYCWRNGGQGDAPTAEFDGYWQPMVCECTQTLQSARKQEH
jgi:lysophospholipase L1-like esterase